MILARLRGRKVPKGTASFNNQKFLQLPEGREARRAAVEVEAHGEAEARDVDELHAPVCVEARARLRVVARVEEGLLQLAAKEEEEEGDEEDEKDESEDGAGTAVVRPDSVLDEAAGRSAAESIQVSCSTVLAFSLSGNEKHARTPGAFIAASAFR